MRTHNSTVSYSSFIRISTYSGNIFLVAGSVGVRVESSNKLTVFQGATVATGTGNVTGAAFQHVQLIISGGKAAVYLNGIKEAEITLVPFAGAQMQLGGLTNGQIDEFLENEDATVITSANIPTVPYFNKTDLKLLGEYGSGKHGAYNQTAAGEVVNTYAPVTAFANSGRTVTIGAQNIGTVGAFTAGDEVMLHLSLSKVATPNASQQAELGFYAVRKIVSVAGAVITLDDMIFEEFNSSIAVANYYVQMVKIANYTTLTVNGSIQPHACNYYPGYDIYAGYNCGGIVAIKTTGNLSLNANSRILGVRADRLNITRTDTWALTHDDMIDRFMIGSGVFLMCGGTLSAFTTAYIGNNRSGNGVKFLVGKGMSGGEGYMQASSQTYGNGVFPPGLFPGFRKSPNLIFIASEFNLSDNNISTGGGGGAGGSGKFEGISGLQGMSGYGGEGGTGGLDPQHYGTYGQSGNGGDGTGLTYIATSDIMQQ